MTGDASVFTQSFTCGLNAGTGKGDLSPGNSKHPLNHTRGGHRNPEDLTPPDSLQSHRAEGRQFTLS